MANSNIHWSVAVCLALACSAGSALAQTTATKFSDGKVKIGVLTKGEWQGLRCRC